MTQLWSKVMYAESICNKTDSSSIIVKFIHACISYSFQLPDEKEIKQTDTSIFHIHKICCIVHQTWATKKKAKEIVRRPTKNYSIQTVNRRFKQISSMRHPKIPTQIMQAEYFLFPPCKQNQYATKQTVC